MRVSQHAQWLRELFGRFAAIFIVVGVAALIAAPAMTQAAVADWPGHGNDSAEQRFSPLVEITAANVSRLGLAWSIDLPGEATLSATPLEVGGTLYFCGGMGVVYAVEARSGKLLWKYVPDTHQANPREARMMFATNRGVAYWEGRVFVALKDGRMVALDANNGAVLWVSRFLIEGQPATSTGAPRAFRGKVIIGNSGAEFGTRGYVTTLDGRTGKLLWRFFITPRDPAAGPDHTASDSVMPMAEKTWSGQWWKYGGGGTPWNGITYDEELNQIYIGTGNGAPWAGRFRGDSKHDNLFLASVVAIDADTGRYKWHYQYNPFEVWDWKATADMILTRLKIGAQSRAVLMQAPSNGFFYVIDRKTGKLISAEKIGKVNWADRIDLTNGRPVEHPGIRYEEKPVLMYPGFEGAHNWQASSYNPVTGLVYIPYMQLGTIYGRSKEADQLLEGDKGILKYRLGVDAQWYIDPQDPMDGRGSLLAWDPSAQKLRWRVDHPFFWNGGTMTTAGNLVFQGDSTSEFAAYQAETGQKLWSFKAGLGIIAPPISYAVAGKQYVSVLVGYGADGAAVAAGKSQGWKYGAQPRRMLTFALDATAALPPTAPPDFSVKPLDDPALVLDSKRVASGEVVYGGAGAGGCGVCHGDSLDAMGLAPDLRESPVALNLAAFRAFVRSGASISHNMPKFDDLSDDQLEDVFEYIRAGARKAKSSVSGAAREGGK